MNVFTLVCLFINSTVLTALTFLVQKRSIRISTAVCAVTNIMFAITLFTSYNFIISLFYVVSMFDMFYVFAFLYRRRALTIAAITNTILCLPFLILALVFHEAIHFVILPAGGLAFVVFYISLLGGRIELRKIP